MTVVDRASAERLLDKLRDLVDQHLDEDERSLFAALIAPGIAQAYAGAEVEGFAVDWMPNSLPSALIEAVEGRQVRIEGL